MRTLRTLALLITTLLREGYEFVLTARFQTDPLERKFSRCRQMNGGNFLVSLREVLSVEKTLLWNTLLKKGINCWHDDQSTKSLSEETTQHFKTQPDLMSIDIYKASLSDNSKEVAVYIAGHVCKQLNSSFKCEDCLIMHTRVTDAVAAEPSPKFLQLLSRNGLSVPSDEIKQYVCNGFAILDVIEDTILKNFSHIPMRTVAIFALTHYGSNIAFACQDHFDCTAKLVSKIIANIYFNNKQKLADDMVRKD